MNTVKIRRVGNSNTISLPRGLERRGFTEGKTVALIPLQDGQILLVAEDQLDAFIDQIGEQVVRDNREALDKLAAYDEAEQRAAAR